MNTVEAMVGREQQVLDHYGLMLTGNKHIDCGICNSKKSLRITIYNEKLAYICKCSNGSIFEYLSQITGKEFREIAQEIDEIIGRKYQKSDSVAGYVRPVPLMEKALNKFKKLPILKDTAGEKYLNNRGIYRMPKLGVRYNPKEGDYESLYSIATNERYDPVYLHRTLLDGEKKADVEKNKKMLSLATSDGQSVAIKLFPMMSTMGIAEGIETALSCVHIYKCSTWSALNSSLLKRFRAPKGVEHLIVFADNDKKGAGHAAAFECAHRNMLANNDVKRVSVRWPASVRDFNDMLQSGSEVYEWVFSND